MMESNKTSANNVLNLSQSLLNELSALYMSERDSDFVFVIEDQRIFAHKFILVLRSEYFRLMLSSGLREAIDNEVELKETSLSAFKDVLYFMYTGLVHLYHKKIDDIIDLLYLGHRYEMHELVGTVTQYLAININEDNVCLIHSTASLFNFNTLLKKCQQYILKNGYKLLSNQALMSLNVKTLIKLFSSDEFCAEEIDIFNAVIKYIQMNSDFDEEICDKLISTVRLPLICWNDLIAYVWPSGFFRREELLESMDKSSENIDNYQKYRKCVQPVVNLKSISNFISDPSVLHCRKYEENLSVILKMPNSFTIDFDFIRFVNYIELDLGNCEKTGYSYYIEVLTSGQWRRIVDYTDYRCHSKQFIYFAKTAVQSIRIYCGVCKSGATNFILNDFKCMIKEIPSDLYSNCRNKSNLDYSSQNINKFYDPLYGKQIDISSKTKSSKKSILKT